MSSDQIADYHLLRVPPGAWLESFEPGRVQFGVEIRTDSSYNDFGRMRRVAALAMVLMLLSIVTVCPLLACPLMERSAAASHSCCHHKAAHPAPCPMQTARECPYTILGKSDRNPAGSPATALLPVDIWPGLVSSEYAPADHAAGRVINSAGLFLRNRTLLI